MNRSSARLLLLIFAGALAVRTLAVLSRQMVQLDETAYLRLGESLAAGNGYVGLAGTVSAHFSPLFPLIIAAFSLVTGSSVFSAYLIVVVFGSLITIPTYLLGKDFFDERIGLMAAALVAVTPLFVDFSSRLYSESVYLFILLLAIHFHWRLLHDVRVRYAVFAGLLLGVAYLANPSTIFYLVAFMALAVAVGIKRGLLTRALKIQALFLAFFLIFALPYVAFIHNATGRWTYTGKIVSENIFSTNNGLRYGTPEWERQALKLTDDGREEWLLRTDKGGDFVSLLLQQPFATGKMFVNQSYIFYTQQLPAVLPLWLLALIGLGLFGSGLNWRRLRAIGYILVMASPVVLVISMYSTERFFMPFLPLALIVVALGWQSWKDWGTGMAAQYASGPRQVFWERAAKWLIGVAVIVPLLILAAGNVAGQKYETQYREAGEWIKSSAGNGKVIMSRWEATSSYYAGGTSVIFPSAEYDRVTAYAVSKNVDYLLIGTQVIRDIRPELSRLTEGESSHPEWRLVNTVRPGTSQEVLIFQRTGT